MYVILRHHSSVPKHKNLLSKRFGELWMGQHPPGCKKYANLTFLVCLATLKWQASYLFVKSFFFWEKLLCGGPFQKVY